jgi:hypothetical protein
VRDKKKEYKTLKKQRYLNMNRSGGEDITIYSENEAKRDVFID